MLWMILKLIELSQYFMKVMKSSQKLKRLKIKWIIVMKKRNKRKNEKKKVLFQQKNKKFKFK